MYFWFHMKEEQRSHHPKLIPLHTGKCSSNHPSRLQLAHTVFTTSFPSLGISLCVRVDTVTKGVFLRFILHRQSGTILRNSDEGNRELLRIIVQFLFGFTLTKYTKTHEKKTIKTFTILYLSLSLFLSSFLFSPMSGQVLPFVLFSSV
jgi:hypothetical protein